MVPNRKTAGLLASLVAVALLAGCIAGDDSGDNRAPEAVLEADKDKAWTGEEITFDAQSSSDPDGNVTQWRFDFGDGTQVTVTEEDAARIDHTYTEGGEYVVKVKVVDDGTGDGLGELTDEESVHVAVDERLPVAASVARTPLDTDAGSMMELPFEAREGADRLTTNLTLQNLLLTGSSEVTLRLHDPSGEVVEEQTYTLAGDEPVDVEFESLLDETGNHTLEVVAKSGAGRLSGDLMVLYSDAPDVDKLEEQADDEA